jgi:NAD(P)-dependent dehydrogenase (short-subunit alcohol dehydrogenase family)
MDLGLNGKIAIVTGGSDGLGKAAAMRLAAEGAKVAIASRDQGRIDSTIAEIKTATGSENLIGISTDVTDESQVISMADAVVAKWGGIDILVNNAGTSAAGKFEDIAIDTWKYDIQLKVYGAIYCSRAALPHLKKSSTGRIINTTTWGGKATPGGTMPTSLSRAAGISLTKAMSKDYAADGILVNTVCVGVLKSGQTERIFEAQRANDPALTLDGFYSRIGAGVPMGRVGESEEVGDVIAFLASDRASYVTGAAINIDGGQSPVV